MKLRTPGTLSAAINDIKTKLSEKTCAEVAERSESLIRKWADPDDPALPNLGQALLLDAAYVRAGFGEPPIQAWYTDRLESIVEENPRDAVNIVLSTLHAQSAIGQIASLVAQFTEDNGEHDSDLSPNERALLMGLIEKLSADLDRLEVALRDDLDFPGPMSLSRIKLK